jgi:DNA-directed RNA polymerase I subunit RPA43
MSALVNSIASPLTTTHASPPSKSKKRKHEDKHGSRSSKKRKNEDAPAEDAATPVAQEPLEQASGKKKRKKSKKDDQASVENVSDNANDASAPEDAPQEIPSSVEDAAPETPSKAKRKKKGNSDINDDDDDKATVEATANGTSQPDNDIELPDAPPTTLDEDALPQAQNTPIADLLASPAPSPFYSTRLSLLLSLPAIAITPQTALPSLLATHLSPLLLTYFPPAKGIVLAFSHPTLTAIPGQSLNTPLRPPTSAATTALTDGFDPTTQDTETLVALADEFGASWGWLTVTLLIFQPNRGDELIGWTNVVSEGFVGVVGYNYFQASVGKARIPQGWKWMGATGHEQQRRRGRKGRLGNGLEPSQETEDAEDQRAGSGPVHGQRTSDDAGYFVDENGEKVAEVLTFRVVDTEMVPAHEAGTLSLQIDATLLDAPAEDALLQEEKEKFERQQQGHGGAEMSGGLARSRQGSVVSAAVGT